MATPCFKDYRFDGTAKQMREVAGRCQAECPVVQLCGEAGIGEPTGIYGGLLPTDPVRVAFRSMRDKKVECANGHAYADYAVQIDSGGPQPITACTRCAALLLQIAVLS